LSIDHDTSGRVEFQPHSILVIEQTMCPTFGGNEPPLFGNKSQLEVTTTQPYSTMRREVRREA
ncbi:MAG: hypothetical protein AB7S98_05880, partial [Burkholderiaceae bacterium]